MRADRLAGDLCGAHSARARWSGAEDRVSWQWRVVMAETDSGPTVLRILLGSQLRRLREAKSVSREDAGYTIRASSSKISRMELGRVGFKERDVADLLTLYGIADGEERVALLSLASKANAPGWWHKYGDVL